MKKEAKRIPFLPGMQLPSIEKENFKTTQTLKVSGQTMLEKLNHADVTAKDAELAECLKQSVRPKQKTRSSQFCDQSTILQSGYQDKDKRVLRFWAYFTEKVFISQIEKEVQRRVRILFYLEDGTLQINEEKVKNSGIVQGDFLKRQKVPVNPQHPDEFLQFTDFRVGQTVLIYQREFTVYDADQFTRDHLSEFGVLVADKQSTPVDDFTINSIKKNERVNNPETKFFKEYVEAKHGGGNPNKGLEQYLQNDRKVLSFSAIWNDDTFAGEANYYTLNYFLADDTVEVKEVQRANSGKHPFPLMLKRAKLPKKIELVNCPGMSQSRTEYYWTGDLVVGQGVKIYGREYMLYDCDEFTREYYRSELGIIQKCIAIQIDRNDEAPERVDPPYNGFGSEQDSLGNCRQLIPKPPRVDMLKMFQFDSIILRFICERITGDSNDKMSNLVLNFYMGDDSLSVYLTSLRNSGILGGKFMERKKYKHKNHYDGFFTAVDFQIGAVLEINHHVMRIISADEFTINYMASHPKLYPSFGLSEIIADLKLQMVPGAASAFNHLLGLLDHDYRLCDFAQLGKSIREFGISMDLNQIFAIFVHCQRNDQGQISMQQLKQLLTL